MSSEETLSADNLKKLTDTYCENEEKKHLERCEKVRQGLEKDLTKALRAISKDFRNHVKRQAMSGKSYAMLPLNIEVSTHARKEWEDDLANKILKRYFPGNVYITIYLSSVGSSWGSEPIIYKRYVHACW